MAQSPSPTSWFSRLRGRAAQPQTDWADLGTAYGLDQSMGKRQSLPDQPPAAPQANLGASRAWWNRLSGNNSGR